MTKGSSERRGAPRVSADLPLQLSGGTGAEPAVLKNISSSGLCCEFGEPLTEMTMLGITMELPGGPLPLRGVVVRCDKRRGVSPPRYEIAVYFTDLAKPARQAILDFVLDRIEAGQTG